MSAEQEKPTFHRGSGYQPVDREPEPPRERVAPPTAATAADWQKYRARPSFNLYQLAALLRRQDPDRLWAAVRYEQRERYENDIIHNAPEPLEEEWSGRIEKKGSYKKRSNGSKQR